MTYKMHNSHINTQHRHLNLPTISVVTPSYNQAQYIRETIESVLSQNYPKLEYIIIDGGSTDDSATIIAEYDNHLSYWVSESDNGQSHAINKGFSVATGDIYCWLNSDDQFATNALWQVALAFMTSSTDMVAGICEIYENDELVHRHLTSCQNGELPINDILDLDNGWNAGQFFYQPEVFFTSALWEKTGSKVREDCFYSMDYELWCRFALNDATLKVIGAPLVKFRAHADQKTAEPEKFKAELNVVRQQFCESNNISLPPSTRPAVSWTKKLNVALVNNLGYKYGAGIAHMRIAGAFEMAGHKVNAFSVESITNSIDNDKFLNQVYAFKPDIVIFGNMHSNDALDLEIIKQLELQYQCFWLTHDFWLLTGRCAYPNSCQQYLNACTQACPTFTEYPRLKPEQISSAWQQKRAFIAQSSNLTMLANSTWSLGFVNKVLGNFSDRVDTDHIKLGFPTDVFKPLDKTACRKALGLTEPEFVIAFSASSFSDKRKGGEFLLEALHSLEIANITLLLIGRLDIAVELPKVKTVSLGYVNDTGLLVKGLNAADLYVGPSLEETFGQVFIEAALCGIPSVGFDTTGVKDAIIDRVTGIKVKEKSASALAKVINMLHQDSELMSQIQTFAPLYARNEFSLEASYHSFFSVLARKNLIDAFELPHKISLKKHSHIVTTQSRGWSDLSVVEKWLFMAKKAFTWGVDVLPNPIRELIVKCIPNWMAKRLMRWIIG